jgi:hypothetical protein
MQIARALVLAGVTLSGCSGPAPGAGSTTIADESSSSTTDTSTTSTDPTTTGGPDEPNPCACTDDEICVSRGFADVDNPKLCEPRPPDCVLSEQCPGACVMVCGDAPCGVPTYGDPEPGVLYCNEPVECECADDELCTFSIDLDAGSVDCVVPPTGCDPADLCSEACADACADKTPLPLACDEQPAPPWLQCPGALFECSLWAQNCPEGEKCAAVQEPEPGLQCVPVSGAPVGVGEPCAYGSPPNMLDNCEAGAVCFGFDPDMQQLVCVPHCSDDEPACPGDTVCAVAADTFNFCAPSCDPLASDCAAGTMCLLVGDAFVCVLDASGDEGEMLDACPFVNACHPGLACLPAEDVPGCEHTTCCTPYCDLEAPACELPDSSCVSLYDVLEVEPLAEHTQVGVCSNGPS